MAAAATSQGCTCTLYNTRTKGMRGGDVLSHRAESEALIGLVRDGLAFAKSGGKARGGGGGGGERSSGGQRGR